MGKALKRKSSLPWFWRALAKGTEKMLNDLLVTVREKIGPIATPDYIQNAPGLPKTRSGMFRGSKDWDWLRPSGGGMCVDGTLWQGWSGSVLSPGNQKPVVPQGKS